MKELHLERKPIDLKEYKLRTAMMSDVSRLIKEDTLIYCDGVPIILYKNLDIDTSAIRWAVKNIPYNKNMRTGGIKTQSTVFGYKPRIALRANFCSTAGLAHTHPKHHHVITDFSKQLMKYYEEYFPNIFEMHKKEVQEKILDEWTIGGTPFTSGIVNKNNQLKYHFDSGNFQGVLSNMIVMKKGTSGGHLIIPEFDIALDVSDKSLTIFNGQDILHGVSPIEYDSETGYRYSIVYYSLQQFWKCETITDEIARARTEKTKKEKLRIDPEHRAELEKLLVIEKEKKKRKDKL